MMRYEYTAATDRCKCRWVARGDQEPLSWFEAVDSPTALASTIKTIIASVNVTGNFLDDVLSIGDIDCAFLKAMGYNDTDRKRYIAFKPHKGAKLQVYELTGGIYGQRDCGLRWWNTLRDFMVTTLGFIQGVNDQCHFIHPVTKLRAVVHVDDLLTRGKSADTKAFWEAITAKFGVKSWGYVTETTPQYYLSMKISCKTQGKQQWYYIDQEEHISQFLVDTNCMDMNPVSAPMPERNELTSDNTPVTKKEHGWVQSIIGSLNYYATHTRYDIAYAVNRVAQYLQAPTKGTILAIRRILAYLVGTKDKKLTVPRINNTTFTIYSDSDHAGDRQVNQTKSVTGVIMLCNGLPIH